MVRAYPSRLLLDDRSKEAGGSYSGEANFDVNVVIILAALLCTLICALGLNSILRCALRCGRRLAFRQGDQGTAGRLAAGLKKSALRRLPISIYSTGMDTRATECIICLGEFSEGEKVRVLPQCKHGFHVMCIDTWLLLHSSCPTCRQSLQIVDGGGTEYGEQSHGNVLPLVVIGAT